MNCEQFVNDLNEFIKLHNVFPAVAHLKYRCREDDDGFVDEYVDVTMYNGAIETVKFSNHGNILTNMFGRLAWLFAII